jgi:hypothetical protein
MLFIAPTVVGSRRAATSRRCQAEMDAIRERLHQELRSGRASLRASTAELEEARRAHGQEPGALTRMEVDFWSATVRRNAREAENAERALARLDEGARDRARI